MNINDMKFAVIGGDSRFVYLAKSLVKSGIETVAYGFDLSDGDCDAVKCRSLSDALAGVNCIILPVPYTKDGIYINSPYFSKNITVEEVFKCLCGKTYVFAGKCDEMLKKAAAECGAVLYDYMDNESIAVLNTVPTAEGAIEIAMKETDYTIHGSRTLVLGFGRVGSILAQKLYCMNASVTVAARRSEVLSLAKAFGYKTVNIMALGEKISDADIIFNTVPNMILDKAMLKNVSSDTLIIDLASSPGGVDISYAKEIGLKAFSVLALPGKCAPKSAGEILKEGICAILRGDKC